jgi:hypothetical protein
MDGEFECRQAARDVRGRLLFCAVDQTVRNRCHAFVQAGGGGAAHARARQNFAAIDG